MDTHLGSLNKILLQTPTEELFELSSYYFRQQNFESAYHILLHIKFKENLIANLHYNLALCAIKMEDITLAKTHLKTEIESFNNKKALFLLEKISSSNSSPPYLTLMISFIVICFYFIFFYEYSTLSLLQYSIHKDNFSVYSAFTSIFFHSSILHLFSNIVVFLLIGSLIEKFISKIHYLSIFLISGILSNMLEVILFSEFSIVLGMSGSIFGLYAVLLLRAPLLKISASSRISIPLLFVTLWIFLLSLVLLEIEGLFIAHYAHLFGFLIGLAGGVLFNVYLRERFYALLLFTLGTLLISSFIYSIPSFFIYPIIDITIGISLIAYSYQYLEEIEKIIEGLI